MSLFKSIEEFNPLYVFNNHFFGAYPPRETADNLTQKEKEEIERMKVDLMVNAVKGAKEKFPNYFTNIPSETVDKIDRDIASNILKIFYEQIKKKVIPR